MTTAEELQTEWAASQPMRGDADKFFRTKAWKHLSLMTEKTAIEGAEVHGRDEGDAVLARNLSFQRGVRWALRFIHTSTQPPKTQEQKTEDPYEHIDETYFQKRREGQPE